MTKLRASRSCLALAAGALALSATAARAEYLQYKLYSVKITSYSVNGPGLDDLPAPPPKVAAAPKKPRPALNVYANLTLNGTALQSAPNGGKREQYDYPGAYAQRFDGVGPGSPKSPQRKAPQARLKLK